MEKVKPTNNTDKITNYHKLYYYNQINRTKDYWAAGFMNINLASLHLLALIRWIKQGR